MEPAYARWALPCFDEPDLKATFKFVIEHRSHMVALVNSIEDDPVEDLGDGWVRTSYKWTPKMSTYLLAFVVGEFDYLQKNTSNGCRVSDIIIDAFFDLVQNQLIESTGSMQGYYRFLDLFFFIIFLLWAMQPPPKKIRGGGNKHKHAKIPHGIKQLPLITLLDCIEQPARIYQH